MSRYQEGYGGLRVDAEVAGHYALLAARFSSVEFHRVGAQPIVESDRITDATEPVVRYSYTRRITIIIDVD
jgi:hypothetical protein